MPAQPDLPPCDAGATIALTSDGITGEPRPITRTVSDRSVNACSHSCGQPSVKPCAPTVTSDPSSLNGTFLSSITGSPKATRSYVWDKVVLTANSADASACSAV